jgi:hypothetical protein
MRGPEQLDPLYVRRLTSTLWFSPLAQRESVIG